MLQNPIFANNAHGWSRYEATTTGLNANNGLAINNATGQYQGNEYLPTENQYRWQPSFTTYPNSETRFGGIYQDIKLVANTWYILSGYVAAHRGLVGVNIESRDGLAISNVTRSYTGNGMAGGYTQGLKDTNRIWIKFKTTANGTARCIFNQYVLANQSSAPFTVLRRPMLEECTEHTTTPSAWQNAGVTSIHGCSIVTNTVTAQQIAANTITANEIAAGTIAARNMAANSINASHIVGNSITADKLNVTHLSAIAQNVGTLTGGTISGTTITGNTISGGTISGTTISGGTIKGARLEGVTGKFTGELEVTQLVGGNIYEINSWVSKKTGRTKTHSLSANGQSTSQTYNEFICKFVLPASKSIRVLYVEHETQGTSESVTIYGMGSNPQPKTLTFPAVLEVNNTISPNVSNPFNGGAILNANTQYTITCQPWCLGDTGKAIVTYRAILSSIKSTAYLIN
ncbi:hypothetical protein [Mannheimia indoligenes]|uniref:hypothetical protein n=1 Tax=Mannheimia indoligenes TaxID=3103145 RepID=UPI002FE62F2B